MEPIIEFNWTALLMVVLLVLTVAIIIFGIRSMRAQIFKPYGEEADKNKTRPIKVILPIAIMILVAAAFPTVGSITGDGFSWKSFSDFSVASKAARAVADIDEPKLDRYIGFSGTRGASSASDMAERLMALEQQGVTIHQVETNLFSCKQGDRFPQIWMKIKVRESGVEYAVGCLATVHEGKLQMIQLYDVWNADDDEPLVDKATPEWIDDLEEVLCTYNPG